ncbi:hypothetical protein H0X32_02200 [Patescibacteria group bacterium]|nr:hypothetical protein [Patescibacteria group bacterium]
MRFSPPTPSLSSPTRFSFETGWVKLFIGWAIVFLIRLIPFRPPNFEPMLATIMPFSKRYGVLGSFLFAVLSIVLFDAVTSGIGVWTAVTALAYGVLGIGSYFFFKNRAASRKNFLTYGIAGTLFYDAVTGLTIGPLQFHETLMSAFIGQIPFTAMHLLGTIFFATTLSPVLYRWVVRNEYLIFSFPTCTTFALAASIRK